MGWQPGYSKVLAVTLKEKKEISKIGKLDKVWWWCQNTSGGGGEEGGLRTREQTLPWEPASLSAPALGLSHLSLPHFLSSTWSDYVKLSSSNRTF